MTYPDIDPVLIRLGPLQIRWYGLMYIIAFLLAYGILVRTTASEDRTMTKQDVGDFLTHAILGVIAGARIGYCLFYNAPYYWHHPLKIFAVWEGGMSFHGGLLGILAGGWYYARTRHKSFLLLGDLTALAAPLGLFFGRVGNFINGELYGRVTNAPWGMVFPEGGNAPRHPSQLYEALLEGLVLFVLLWGFKTRRPPRGSVLALFFLGYGVFRFFLEFFREPDPQLGFVFGPFTMGQMLCVAMVVVGAILFRVAARTQRDTG